MARTLLLLFLLAGSLAMLAEGKSRAAGEARLANCRSALAAVGTRSPFEVAALCRSTLPSDTCRDALKRLGPQPWRPEKVSAACEKYVPMLAPVGESKGRFLDDIEEKLEHTQNCSTVDPMTGVKTLTVSPWKPPPPGTNPFETPVYILSSGAKATPYVAPTPEDHKPADPEAKVETPPEGSVVKGVLEANMADGQRFVVEQDTEGNLQAAIAEAAGVEDNVVSVGGIVAKDSGAVNVSFIIHCPAYIETVTVAHNLVFYKSALKAALKGKVAEELELSHVFLTDSYGGAHLKPADRVSNTPSAQSGVLDTYTMDASMFALEHMPPLPKSIAPTAVLGTVSLKLAEIASVGSDLAFQKAILAVISEVAQVDVAEVLVTSLEIIPKISKSGTISISGQVEVYFSISMPDEQTAEDIEQRFADCHVEDFSYRLRSFMSQLGSNQHTIIVQSVTARLAREVAAAQPAVVEGASEGKEGVISKVDVRKGRTLAKDSVLAATRVTGVMACAALCAVGAFTLAKVLRRTPWVSLREVPLAEDHWGSMSRAEMPTLSCAQVLE